MDCPRESEVADFFAGRAAPELRRQLEAHFARCSRCLAVIAALQRERSDASLDSTLGASTPGVASDRQAPALGAALGHFILLERLGQGAMGTVNVAYDRRLDRKVAIKLVRGEKVADPLSRARMLREARAMAKITHPHVVAVHEANEYEDGVYVVMELVRGSTLRAWLAALPRPLEAILDTFIQAGRGLAAAHAAGLVHRDFKPENVLVDDAGHVKVGDFGLARAAETVSVAASGSGESSAPDQDASRDVTLTATGASVGTPAYMSPEQWQGRSADARSDIFAFGVALFEAIHGHRPFRGETMAALAAAVQDGVIVDAPARVKVPTKIHLAIRRALATDPDARWPTMEPLLAELASIPGRRRRQLASISAVGLLAAGISVGVLWSDDSAAACAGGASALATNWDADRRIAVVEALRTTPVPSAAATAAHTAALLDTWADAWIAAHREACEATHVRHEQSASQLDRRMACLDERRRSFAALVGVLAEADARTTERAVAAATALPTLDRCADLAWLVGHSEATNDPARTPALADAHALAERSWHLIQTAHYETAATEIAAGQANARVLADAPLQARWAVLAGHLKERLGAYAEAEAILVDAYFAARTARADEQAIHAATNLVNVVGNRLARFDDGSLWWRLALADLGTAPAVDFVARLHSVWGGALATHGRYAEAIAELTEAITLRTRERGPDHLDLAGPLNSLGVAQFRQGDHAAARASYMRALQIREQQLGPEHPDVARTLSNLASVQLELQELDAAEASERRALAIREHYLGPDHPDVAASLGNLGLIALRRGAHDDAEAALTRSLEILRARLGDDHPRVAETQLNLAAARAEAGRLAEAAASTREVIRVWTASLGPTHPNVGAARANLADLLRRLGDAEQARAEVTTALADLEAALGPSHLDLGFPLVTLARLELAAGHLAAAERAVLRALEIRTASGALGELASTRSVAAQVLAATGSDPPRVRELATQALAELVDTPATREDRAALATLLAR